MQAHEVPLGLPGFVVGMQPVSTSSGASARRCRAPRGRDQNPRVAPLTRGRRAARTRPGVHHPAARGVDLVLDDFGSLTVRTVAEEILHLGECAQALCAALGDLLARPIECISVRANPVGPKLLASVASREVARSGPVLRCGAASAADAPSALLEALVTAHFGSDTVLRGAVQRLVEDGTVRSAILVEAGAEQTFGLTDDAAALASLAAGVFDSVPTAVEMPDLQVRVLVLGSTVLALTTADAAAAGVVDRWWTSVTRHTTAPSATIEP